MKSVTERDLLAMESKGAKVSRAQSRPKPRSNLPRNRTPGQPPISSELSKLATFLDKRIELSVEKIVKSTERLTDAVVKISIVLENMKNDN